MNYRCRPHVLVLCLDTVRKDFYDRFAPRLRDRATVTFEEMRAASSWSVPSHASMLTGELPSEHGVHAHNRDFETLDHESVWLDDLDEYHRTCISANIYASEAFGFDSLFDDCYRVSPECWFPAGIDVNAYIRDRDVDEGLVDFVRDVITHEAPLRSLANGAIVKAADVVRDAPVRSPFDAGARNISTQIERILAEATEPEFVFANLMDAHGPHTPFRGLDPSLYDAAASYTSQSFDDWGVNVADGLGRFEDDVEAVRDLYAAEIDYLDRRVAALLDRLEDLDREVITVITADHGENLGFEADNYLMNHTSSLTEALLHVPCDVVASGYDETVTDYTSHLDLGELIVRLIEGQPVKDGLDGPIAAEIAGSGTGLPDTEDADRWNQAMRAVYDPDRDRKYVRSERDEVVYDVSGDASTQTRTDESIPDGVFVAFEVPFATVAGQGDTSNGQSEVDLDPSVEDRLKELGYK